MKKFLIGVFLIVAFGGAVALTAIGMPWESPLSGLLTGNENVIDITANVVTILVSTAVFFVGALTLFITWRMWRNLPSPLPIPDELPQLRPKSEGKPVTENVTRLWDDSDPGIIFEDGGTVSLARMPTTDPDLFGREAELAKLDAAWERPQTNVISLVAWGGQGKTALVNVWLNRMAQDKYRGAERIFGWSFNNQGETEVEQTSAAPFLAAALEWFGDSNPREGSPWDQGVRLARCIRQHRTLLVLDGLDPLQNPRLGGQLTDPGLKSLLRELARQNPGLCVLTSRLSVDDLKEFAGTLTDSIELEQLSIEAGMELLQKLGAKGAPDELGQAVKEYEGHALGLTLLGRYVDTVYEGDIRQRNKIPEISKMDHIGGRQGIHARRVMESYESWFDGEIELSIIRLMGLFYRPVIEGAFQVLIAEPGIVGLTALKQSLIGRVISLVFRPNSAWTKLSYDDRQVALSNLRNVKLLAKTDPRQPTTLDTQPLVREYFREKLKKENPRGWREAHRRLYEYYKSVPKKEFPDTAEEMALLYTAVRHGCEAELYQEAFDEVYLRRTQRGSAGYGQNAFGENMSADLAALSGFFDRKTSGNAWHQPVKRLNKFTKGYVLNEVGWNLRTLGQLKESIQPMKNAMEVRSDAGDWIGAANSAANLTVVHLQVGEVSQALLYAEQGVKLAQLCADEPGPWGPQGSYNRAFLGDALHKAGQMEKAEAAFHAAEAIQQESDGEHPLLYSVLAGFVYCDFLLDQGKYQDTIKRASQTMEWHPKERLRDIALDHLSLGRAHMLEAQRNATGDFTRAEEHLAYAVDGLRQAGQQDQLLLGLLAHAMLRRVQGRIPEAWACIREILEIAELGPMRLHEADAYLESARLYEIEDDHDKARGCLDRAKGMIDEMGYHCRDGAVEELEKALVTVRG